MIFVSLSTEKNVPLLLLYPLFSHLTSYTPTKSNLHLANSLTAVVSEPVLYWEKNRRFRNGLIRVDTDITKREYLQVSEKKVLEIKIYLLENLKKKKKKNQNWQQNQDWLLTKLVRSLVTTSAGSSTLVFVDAF